MIPVMALGSLAGCGAQEKAIRASYDQAKRITVTLRQGQTLDGCYYGEKVPHSIIGKEIFREYAKHVAGNRFSIPDLDGDTKAHCGPIRE